MCGTGRGAWRVAVLTEVVLLSGTLWAADWVNPGTGSWFETNNWSGKVIPSGEAGWIRNGGTAVLDGPGATPSSIIPGADAGPGHLIVTPDGSATLTVDLVIANNASHAGSATMNGGSLRCRILQVGQFGAGTLTMAGGTLVATYAGTALYVGNYSGSSGEVEINGGRLQINRDCQISANNGSRGSVTVSESGAFVVSNSLIIGNGGDCDAIVRQLGGTIQVPSFLTVGGGTAASASLRCEGGTLNGGYLFSTKTAGSHADIVFTGTNSSSFSAAWRMGRAAGACGVVSVSNQASVVFPGAALVYLGGYASDYTGQDTTGRLAVAGGTLSGPSATVYVGEYGRGQLNVSGGNLTLNNIRLGNNPGAFGEAAFSGGTNTAALMSLALVSGATGRVSQTGGRVDVTQLSVGANAGATADSARYTLSGGVLKCATLTRTAGGSGLLDLQGGTLSANLIATAFGTLINNGAAVSPAYTAIGKTQIQSGDYTETSPTCAVEVQIGGTVQGTTYDWVQVNQKITLAGNLRVSFANGFEQTVTAADKFYVMASDAATAIEGAFANVAPGGWVTTAERHTFRVYYGANHNGNGAYRVTLTEFRPWRPTGTVVSVQ